MTESAAGPRVPAPLIEANLATAEDIARLLRAHPDPAAAIPGARWTVGEAAAHLVLANALMADLARGLDRPYGDGTPAGLAAANDDGLADYPERDPRVLADALVAHTRDYAEQAAARAADEPVDTPMGPMDQGTLASYLLTHQLGHGYDLARALRQPHMVDSARVVHAVPFLLRAMPRVVDPTTAARLDARFAVNLRGGPRFWVSVAGGTATVSEQPPAHRPDCTIMAEPVSFFLLALGRRSTAQAVLTGSIVAWGRKPWLAPRFASAFRAP
ncbi:maleylpyruvate isomerase family mycothiol-dependent enzyme [Kitasatospora sp. LaBMicrA B282]|uniref:maleylpyruvate isomerase family mycothiol-dependent enzyme n=1 Tax=Kitasatospora sp. LaBMicrA B282 TaxID=3420949 RepID=UPI003D116A81